VVNNSHGGTGSLGARTGINWDLQRGVTFVVRLRDSPQSIDSTRASEWSLRGVKQRVFNPDGSGWTRGFGTATRGQ